MGTTGTSDSAELDDLLDELRGLKLDLPVSRGTDGNDRKLGSLGGAEPKSITARAAPNLAAGSPHAPLRPSTAHLLEEIERQGLESLSSPVELDRSGSFSMQQRLEDSVLREISTPTAASPQQAPIPDSIDALLDELDEMDRPGGNTGAVSVKTSEGQDQTGAARNDRTETSRGCRIA
jgi:hypothetical protein